MKTWFGIQTSLIDRNDLNAYEKLCCVVMARYAGRPEFDHLITIQTLSKKMGVDVETTKRTLKSLFDKGLITQEISTSMDIDLLELDVDSNIIKSDDVKNEHQDVKAMEMPSWDNDVLDDAVNEDIHLQAENVANEYDANKYDVSTDDEQLQLNLAARKLADSIKKDDKSLDRVMAIIEEPINARQGRIILGLANGDIVQIKHCYDDVKQLPPDERIDALIESLQTNAGTDVKITDESSAIREHIGGQVNKYRLEQMKKYSKLSGKKRI